MFKYGSLIILFLLCACAPNAQDVERHQTEDAIKSHAAYQDGYNLLHNPKSRNDYAEAVRLLTQAVTEDLDLL